MFTGIIEAVGRVISARSGGGGMALSIDLKGLSGPIRLGESIAVNGVCLTVSQLDGSAADFDVSGETINRSTLSRLRSGTRVNLERAMASDGRFGGHIVQGHIDGIGTIAAIRKKGSFAEFSFSAPADLLEAMVEKGSVALDGISLTVTRMDPGGFTVALIPTTLAATTWSQAKSGDEVNIETDILIKVVKKQLDRILPSKGNLTAEKLRELGF
ncbi:MAG: riboflavin synthase [Phycisphaerae bacterium]|nr:riboflavin synthase [Phycisphaerae bacterium]